MNSLRGRKWFLFIRYTVSSNLSAREIFHAHFDFFGNLAYSVVWSEPLLVYRRLFFCWEGWSAVCLLFSGSSISEGSPGEAPPRHLQITSTGKMWLTWVTVLSFHGYCSGSRCCLWAKSLETINDISPITEKPTVPAQEAEKKVAAGKQGYSKKSRFPSPLKY